MSLLSFFKNSFGSDPSRESAESIPPHRYRVEKLILSREKVALPSYVLDGQRDPSGKIRPTLVRFTRLRIVIRDQSEERHVSVLGQRASTVLRLGAFVTQEVERLPAFLFRTGPSKTDWPRLWNNALEAAFKEHRAGQWIAVFVDGEAAFSSGEVTKFNEAIGSVGVGVDLTAELIASAASKAVGDGGVVPLKYTGQTYVAISHSGNSYRGALIDRNAAHNRTLFAYAPIASAKSRVLKTSRFALFCADIMDGIAMRSTIAGVRAMSESEQKAREEFLMDATTFQKNTLARIVGFERAQRVVFRPERPNFE